MKSFVDNDNWHDAKASLITAKSKYYEDYNLLIKYAEEDFAKYLVDP